MNRHDTLTPCVLVAGAAGFIGSHLSAALLERGRRVIAVDNFLTGSRHNLAPLASHPGFTLIEQDVCTPIEIAGRVHEVYNLACPASPPLYQADPVHTLMTNVVGTSNLLKLAAAHDARFLQASTSEVYGDPEQHPQNEAYWGHVNCTGPRACYDEGKRAAETLCFDLVRQGRVDTRVARIFNTYGPGMRPDDGRIVSNLIVQALEGAPLTIYGSGRQTRSFCYVGDLVGGLMALMEVEANPEGPINLGNPGEFSVLRLARMVLDKTGSRSRLVFCPLPRDDPQRRRPDIGRAREVLGWAPRVPLSEGLDATIGYFRSRLGVPARAAGRRPAAARRQVAALAGGGRAAP